MIVMRRAGEPGRGREAVDESQENEIPVYRVDGNFRGVMLEAGNWTVRFRYSPLTLRWAD